MGGLYYLNSGFLTWFFQTMKRGSCFKRIKLQFNAGLNGSLPYVYQEFPNLPVFVP